MDAPLVRLRSAAMCSSVLRWPGSVLLLCMSACTSIPQQFAAYREASRATREQSEIVIADHEAARRTTAALRSQSAAEPTAGQPLTKRLRLAGLDVALDPIAIDVQARMDAWKVVARYDDALLSIATGASSAEIEGAVDGLLEGLNSFPVKAVGDAATEIAPYAPVVKELLALVQREVEARHFREAVLAAEKPMQEFGEALLADARLFYEYRLVLLQMRFDDLEPQLVEFAERARERVGARSWPPGSGLDVLLKRLERARFLATGQASFAALDANVDAAAARPSAAELSELASLTDACERVATEGRALVAELVAYDSLMRTYVQLLREFVRQQGELARAVRENSNRPPSVKFLRELVTAVTLARNIYSSNR